MRIRTIKPAFWKSLTITTLPFQTRLHFIGLWNYADDEGRGLDDARLLRAELWPLDEKTGNKAVERMQAELARAGLIKRYSVGGRSYFEIPSWPEHQRVDKPQRSTIPPSSVADAETMLPGTFPEGSRLEGKGREGKGRGKDSSALSPRRRDVLWDALAGVDGADVAEVTEDAARACGVALAKIRRVTPELTPDEIARRGAVYRARFPGAALTPSALAKHWADCSRPPSNGQNPSIRHADRAAEILEEAMREGGSA